MKRYWAILAPGVIRSLNVYGLRFPEMRSPFLSPLWERSLKPANDDSERREDDQGKVRLHLTLGNNQNGRLPTMKAHTANSYEINKYSYNLALFTAIFVCHRATSAVPIGALIFDLCLVSSRDYFRSFQATRTGIAYSNLHIKKFEKLIFFQPSHESNLLFPVTFTGV